MQDLSTNTAKAYVAQLPDHAFFMNMLQTIDEHCAEHEDYSSTPLPFTAQDLLGAINNFYTKNDLESLRDIFNAGRADEAPKLLARILETGEPIDSEAVKLW